MQQRDLLDSLVQVVVAHEDVLESAHVAEIMVNVAASCIVEHCLAVVVGLALYDKTAKLV